MKRVTMNVDGTSYALAQGQDTAAIKEEVVRAARDGAGLVTVTLYGNRALDVVVTPGVPITFETEEVRAEIRNDGDLHTPFEAPRFDYDLGYDRA